jgi:hypothetical protein
VPGETSPECNISLKANNSGFECLGYEGGKGIIECRSKSKKCDELIKHTILVTRSVRGSVFVLRTTASTGQTVPLSVGSVHQQAGCGWTVLTAAFIYSFVLFPH